MIAAARALAGWTPAELAKAAGVCASTVSNVEAGRSETRKENSLAIRNRGVALPRDAANRSVMITAHYAG